MRPLSVLRGPIPYQQLLSSQLQRHNSTDAVTPVVRLMWTAGVRHNLALGALRRALFAYLYARSQRGRWILYVTHPKVDAKFAESQLAQFGLFPDEGPSAGGQYGPYTDPADFYVKSRQFAERLLNERAPREVYRCFCAKNLHTSTVGEEYITCRNHCDEISPEASRQLATHRPFMIRLKASRPLKSDTVLIDVNGAPTICYKNALRQRNMRVTHAIADTMRQLVYNRIYKMIGFEQCPQHLPVGRLLIRNHGKICTQHSPESHLFFYQSLLYQPVALINWLLDGHGIRDYDSTKLYSLDELVEKFEPDLCFNSERRGFCIVDLARLLQLDRLYHHSKNEFAANHFSFARRENRPEVSSDS